MQTEEGNEMVSKKLIHNSFDCIYGRNWIGNAAMYNFIINEAGSTMHLHTSPFH